MIKSVIHRKKDSNISIELATNNIVFCRLHWFLCNISRIGICLFSQMNVSILFIWIDLENSIPVISLCFVRIYSFILIYSKILLFEHKYNFVFTLGFPNILGSEQKSYKTLFRDKMIIQFVYLKNICFKLNSEHRIRSSHYHNRWEVFRKHCFDGWKWFKNYLGSHPCWKIDWVICQTFIEIKIKLLYDSVIIISINFILNWI